MYVQRRLEIRSNRAASIMERMEKHGIGGLANHAGQREILRTSSRWHRQLNNLRQVHPSGGSDQALATPVTSAQTRKA